MTRWRDAVGEGSAERYAERFAALAASGADVHGEARFCEELVPPGALVLDAGCGTGRVAIELSRRRFRCVGIDVDPSMIEHARLAAPDNQWIQQDLTTLDLPERFDLIVAAGNVIPLLAAGTEAQTVRKLTAHLRQTASWSPDSESMRLICRWPRLHSVSSTTTPGANKLG